MAWQVTHAGVDFSNNRAVVNLVDPGGIDVSPRNIDVSFSVAEPNQPISKNVDLQSVLAQAKQVLSDASKLVPDTAAIALVRKG